MLIFISENSRRSLSDGNHSRIKTGITICHTTQVSRQYATPACRRMFVINYCRREAKDLLMTASKGLFAPGNLRDSRPHSITLNISPTGFFSLGLISCAGFPTATNAKSEYGSFTPSSLLSSSFATIGPVCQHAP